MTGDFLVRSAGENPDKDLGVSGTGFHKSQDVSVIAWC